MGTVIGIIVGVLIGGVVFGANGVLFGGVVGAFVGFIVVAPVLVLLSYVIGPAPMDLRFWPGAVVMMLIATLTASLVTNSGRSAWFVGVLVLIGARRSAGAGSVTR